MQRKETTRDSLPPTVLAADSNVSRHICGCTLPTKSLARADVWVKLMKNVLIDVSASSLASSQMERIGTKANNNGAYATK